MTQRLNTSQRSKGGFWPTLLAWVSVLTLFIAVLLMAGAGPAYRWQLLGLGEAFALLRNGVYAAAGAMLLSVILLVVSGITRRFRAGVVAVVVMAATLALLYSPWQQWQRAQQAPVIHDITTDMQNPPVFTALKDAREAAPNPVDYPGEATARQQRAAYPNVQPLVVDGPVTRVLAAAQAEVEASGWQVAAITENTLEATATTQWFGFEDDVVVRLTEQQDAVRVDMRSASRLGASDIGTNAQRIETFLTALRERLE